MKNQTQIIPARMIRTEERDPTIHDDAIQQQGWRSAAGYCPRPFATAVGYRVRCGFGHTWGTGNPCSGNLGHAWPLVGAQEWAGTELERLRQAMIYAGRVDELFALEDAEVWYLEHPQHVRHRDDGIFVTMKGKERGRRPLPKSMRLLLPSPGQTHQTRYGIVGDLAIIPLLIECPNCRRINRVDVPPKRNRYDPWGI